MKYVEFMERVRRSLAVYEGALTSYFEGESTKEDAEKAMLAAKQDIARQLEYYDKNKEDEIDIGQLCPRCNMVKSIMEGGQKLAVHPSRVGQFLHRTSDSWRGYEWNECPICGCQKGMSKIEHWE